MNFLQPFIEYFQSKPYWSKVQPIFAFVSLFISVQVLVYQYIQWQYGISPSIFVYLRSYIFIQLSVLFAIIAIIGIFFKPLDQKGKQPRGVWRKHAGTIIKRVTLAAIVLAVAIPIMVHFLPAKASNIRIKFMSESDSKTDFDKYALVYIIYELNRRQQNWHFDVDFDVFDESILTSNERRMCDGQNSMLCYAELNAKESPFIGIATGPLGQDFFWQNRKTVSVISTYRWQQYAPPSVYEYLAYTIILNSILIHLNTLDNALPEYAFKESRDSYGDLFQSSPDRNAMKAAILAAHLSPKGEELLFNCFGVQYMSVCSDLLTMEWLHSKQITDKLKKSYGIEP